MFVLQPRCVPQFIREIGNTNAQKDFNMEVCATVCCPVGFDKPPGESGVMLCQANGKWRGHFPDC